MLIICIMMLLPEAVRMLPVSEGGTPLTSHFRRLRSEGAMPNCLRKAAAKWLALV